MVWGERWSAGLAACGGAAVELLRGDIHVTGTKLEGDISLLTAEGDIHVGKIRGESVAVQAPNGDIDVRKVAEAADEIFEPGSECASKLRRKLVDHHSTTGHATARIGAYDCALDNFSSRNVFLLF